MTDADFWQRCAAANCVVAAVRVYSQWGADGNTDEAFYVGIRYWAMEFWNRAAGPDYYVDLEDGRTGLDSLHKTPEAALRWFEQGKPCEDAK